MPTNALENPLVLPILGLLAEKPRHGYGVFVQLRDRYTQMAVRRSTVYTLLDRLTEVGWLNSAPISHPRLTPSPRPVGMPSPPASRVRCRKPLSAPALPSPPHWHI